LAMERAGLREQFGCAAHEHFLLSAHGREPCPEFHARRSFGTRA
jgi:hypothetical protein